MAPPRFSYTKEYHTKTYDDINPTLSGLSTKGKVVLITGATGGIGSAAASSFAASGAKALILFGRKKKELEDLATLVGSSREDLIVKFYQTDICNPDEVRSAFNDVATEFGRIDILVHTAAYLPTLVHLLHADPEDFLEGFRVNVLGTLVVAQAAVLANRKAKEAKESEEPKGSKQSKDLTFINVTTAGVVFPPFEKMGAYISSKLAAVKLLQAFSMENNGEVRLHNVHPGVINTDMTKKLEESVDMGYPHDDISLPPDFLVWVASPEAEFLDGKIVFANWDVNELKSRQKEIVGIHGDLFLHMKGFP